MPDPVACVRRLYRLSILLTLDVSVARRALKRILTTSHRIDRIDSAHLDRLTILGCREIGAVNPATLAIASPGLDYLAALSMQQREAWVLARVYRVPEREMARSMDCSTTAARRHLELADKRMADVPDQTEFVDELLRFTLALDAPSVEIRRQQRRHRWRRSRPWIVLVLILGMLIAAFVVARTWYAQRMQTESMFGDPAASPPEVGPDADAASASK